MAELTDFIIEVVEKSRFPEDMKQDFYVAWLESEEELTFENKAHTASYIRGFINNLTNNNKKVEKNRVRLIMENADQIAADLHVRQDFGIDPAEVVEFEQEILIKIDSLSAALRNSFIQYYVEGRSPEEIAETNNENVEAVRKRITRARNQLQEVK